MGPFDLPKTTANSVPLSPLTFLTRTAAVHPDRLAVVHGAASQDLAPDGGAVAAGLPRRWPGLASARVTPWL